MNAACLGLIAKYATAYFILFVDWPVDDNYLLLMSQEIRHVAKAAGLGEEQKFLYVWPGYLNLPVSQLGLATFRERERLVRYAPRVTEAKEWRLTYGAINDLLVVNIAYLQEQYDAIASLPPSEKEKIKNAKDAIAESLVLYEQLELLRTAVNETIVEHKRRLALYQLRFKMGDARFFAREPLQCIPRDRIPYMVQKR